MDRVCNIHRSCVYNTAGCAFQTQVSHTVHSDIWTVRLSAWSPLQQQPDAAAVSYIAGTHRWQQVTHQTCSAELACYYCCASLAVQLAACLALAKSQHQLLLSVMVTDCECIYTKLLQLTGCELVFDPAWTQVASFH